MQRRICRKGATKLANKSSAHLIRDIPGNYAIIAGERQLISFDPNPAIRAIRFSD